MDSRKRVQILDEAVCVPFRANEGNNRHLYFYNTSSDTIQAIACVDKRFHKFTLDIIDRNRAIGIRTH